MESEKSVSPLAFSIIVPLYNEEARVFLQTVNSLLELRRKHP